MNIIHYMHDKYAYEASQMALHDTQVERLTAFGIAGLSVAADSLSAIRYASVRPVRNEAGVAVEFETEGDFPKYGNDDDRADDEAVFVVRTFGGQSGGHSGRLLLPGAHHLNVNVMDRATPWRTPWNTRRNIPVSPSVSRATRSTSTACPESSRRGGHQANLPLRPVSQRAPAVTPPGLKL